MKPSFSLLFYLLFFGAATGQEIVLDKLVRAGDLIVFPSVSNPNEYYYLSDKARLATHAATGKAQFLFLRYAEPKRSEADQPDRDQADGGGIVHCVIELGVTEEQRRAAQQDLGSINSAGIIKGPALYTGGTIALVSSVNDPESGFSKKVLGLGKAPILDGQKAAISINLTKLGAKILWETFKTPTPDMSFSFEMDLKGYKSPKRAIIEANFDQIYESKSFAAAIVSRQGSTVLGGEINAAFEDLTRSGAIKVTLIGADENMEKAIDDAYSKLTRMMFDPASENNAAPNVGAITGAGQTSMLDKAQQLLQSARADALEDYNLFQAEDEQSEQSQNNSTNPNENSNNSNNNNNNNSNNNTPQPSPDQPSVGYHSRTRPPSTDMTPNYQAQHSNRSRPVPTMPTTAIVASYTMKTVRQRGIYKIDLNKYTADNLSMRFDHNVGYINCQECFREVSLDDDLTRQREIASILDGFNSDDFQKYINYVNVQMKKKHGNGEFSTDEVRIDRAKFNQQGNYFKMLYGWKGDSNRAKWKEYEYKTIWSFFGGGMVESTWAKADANTIPLIPPYQRKVVDIEADADKLATAGVRSASIKIAYIVAGKQMTKETRLNPKNGQLTAQIEILKPSDDALDTGYEYETTWMMTDGSTQTSGKKKSTASIVFLDML